MAPTLKAVVFSMLLSLAHVHGTTTPTSYKDFNTTFDTVATTPEGGPVALPDPLDGLRFGGFRANNDGVTLLHAKSSPSKAGSSQLKQLLQGGPPPNITVKYPNTRVRFFSLLEAYVGCGVASLGSVPVGGTPSLPSVLIPQSCQLLFQGVNSKGGSISQTCSFSGTPQMQQCVFSPMFLDAITINITVTSALTLPETTTLVLDNVIHRNYY